MRTINKSVYISNFCNKPAQFISIVMKTPAGLCVEHQQMDKSGCLQQK